MMIFYFLLVPLPPPAVTAMAVCQLDVVRTRVMTAPADRDTVTSTSPLAVLHSILAAEGMKALFAGLTPRLIRAVGSGAIQFASYEVTQNFIHRL